MDLFLSLILVVLLAALYAFHQQQRHRNEPGIFFIGALFDLIAAYANQPINWESLTNKRQTFAVIF